MNEENKMNEAPEVNQEKEKNNKNEDLGKTQDKKATVKIKKNVVYAIAGVIFVLVAFAFINASIKNTKTNIEKKISDEQPSQVRKTEGPQLPVDYRGLKSNKDERNSEVNYSNINKNENLNVILNEPEILGANIKMEEYYTQLLQTELQSRHSEITYSMSSSTLNEKKEEIKDEDIQNLEYNKYKLRNPISEYEIKAGGFIPGILLTGVDSQIEGVMIGIVREDVYDSKVGKTLLIPKGTKILGSYDSGVAYGQDRLLIIWERLLFPNGKSLMLDKFPGVDLSGYAGMKGKVNNHNFELFKSVVLSSILGGTAALVNRDSDRRIQSWENAMAVGAGERILDIGDAMIERILNIKPNIYLKQGTRFNIIINADLLLEPYKD